MFGQAETKTQLYFSDTNTFEFKRRMLQYSCFVEKKGDRIVRAWPHSYAGQYSFPGYKNIPAGMITLGFGRDIFLDPHKKIPEGEDISDKPKREKESIKKWIARIAENQRHTFRVQRKSHTTANLVNYTLLGVLALEIIGWLVRFLTGG